MFEIETQNTDSSNYEINQVREYFSQPLSIEAKQLFADVKAAILEYLDVNGVDPKSVYIRGEEPAISDLDLQSESGDEYLHFATVDDLEIRESQDTDDMVAMEEQADSVFANPAYHALTRKGGIISFYDKSQIDPFVIDSGVDEEGYGTVAIDPNGIKNEIDSAKILDQLDVSSFVARIKHEADVARLPLFDPVVFQAEERRCLERHPNNVDTANDELVAWLASQGIVDIGNGIALVRVANQNGTYRVREIKLSGDHLGDTSPINEGVALVKESAEINSSVSSEFQILVTELDKTLSSIDDKLSEYINIKHKKVRNNYSDIKVQPLNSAVTDWDESGRDWTSLMSNINKSATFLIKELNRQIGTLRALLFIPEAEAFGNEISTTVTLVKSQIEAIRAAKIFI